MDQIVYALAEQHRHNLLDEAAQVRRARHAHNARPQRNNAALARLGERLIAWGWWLRARYGALEQTV